MVWIQVQVVGDADEVIRFLGHLGGRGGETVRIPDGGQVPATGQYRAEANPAPELAPAAGSPAPPSGGWTEELAADFTASLDAVARRMMLHVWRAGERGIHRSALCQRAELTPAELRSLLMRMGHARRRFQRERGMALSRPVASNSPLQSYFVDPDFAAAATSHAFGGVGRPYWVPVFGRSGQITVYRLWTALAMMTCLLVALACGEDSDDRMVRRYARLHGGPQHHPASADRGQRRRGRAAERRGDGGAVARSTGARRGHDGGNQGRPRLLLRIGLADSCGNGVGKGAWAEEIRCDPGGRKCPNSRFT